MEIRPPICTDGWAVVCHVESPSKFFIRKDTDAEKFRRLQRMIRCHESFDPLIPPEVNDPQDIKRIIASAPTVVLARSKEYGGIQRASIQKPSQDQLETDSQGPPFQVCVFFVDVGETVIVEDCQSQIWLAPDEISAFSGMAITAKLYGVVPSDRTIEEFRSENLDKPMPTSLEEMWSSRSIEDFKYLVTGCDTRVFMETFRVEGTTRLVDLIVKNRGDVANISIFLKDVDIARLCIGSFVPNVVNQPPKTIVEIEPIDYLMPNTFVQVKFLGINNPEAIQIQVSLKEISQITELLNGIYGRENCPDGHFIFEGKPKPGRIYAVRESRRRGSIKYPEVRRAVVVYSSPDSNLYHVHHVDYGIMEIVYRDQLFKLNLKAFVDPFPYRTAACVRLFNLSPVNPDTSQAAIAKWTPEAIEYLRKCLAGEELIMFVHRSSGNTEPETDVTLLRRRGDAISCINGLLVTNGLAKYTQEQPASTEEESEFCSGRCGHPKGFIGRVRDWIRRGEEK